MRRSLPASHCLNLVVAVLLLIGQAPVFAEATPTDAPERTSPARLELEWTSNQFLVGTVVEARLLATEAQTVAGFQAVLKFDPHQLTFAGASVGEGLAREGYTAYLLGPARLEDAVAVGAVTCAVRNCHTAEPATARLQPQPLSGRVEVARVRFYVEQPGPVVVTLSEVQLVDSFGGPLADGALPPSATAVGGWDARLDITGNGFINDADAWQLIAAWEELREANLCRYSETDPRDVDRDGCVSVADVQRVLGAWGRSAPQFQAHPGGAAFGVIQAATPVTFTVNSPLDEADLTPGDGQCLTSSGVCTLVAAVEEGNVRAGHETILFNIRNPDNSCPSAPVTIQPALGVQIEIDEPLSYGMTIDGYSQCGAALNTSATHVGNAVIRIQLQGQRVTYNPDGSRHHGLEIQSPNVTVRGLAIFDYDRQMYVLGPRAQNVRIEGNFLATNFAYSNSRFGEGLRLQSAMSNTVGGVTPAARNIIGGSSSDGINLEGDGADYNVVVGNYIGLRQDGLTTRPNTADGIDVAEGASYNRIGGLAAGERNVISGNGRDGIEISHESVSYNQFIGNYIGLAADGLTPRGNGENGVTLEDLVYFSQIKFNVIVNNGWNGVRLIPHADNNVIESNYVGLLPSGAAMGNGANPTAPKGRNGFNIYGGSQSNLIKLNSIANHPEYGILVSTKPSFLADAGFEAYFNTLSQNSIYNNGLSGIKLERFPGQLTYGNQGMPAPIITSPSPFNVKGSATMTTGAPCAACAIEIFIADDTPTAIDPSGETAGEGRTFIGSGLTTASGAFTITVSGVAEGQKVTATATDLAGNTSGFSTNKVVVLNNDPPLAVADLITTAVDTPVTIDVLANDSDPNGQPLMVTNVGMPPQGSAATDGAQVFFTPTLGYSGTQSFLYTVSDSELTDSAIITVTVDPNANRLPIANNDVASTPEDTPLSVATALLLANDSDPNGDILTVTQVSPFSALGGPVTLAGNQIVFTPTLNFFGSDILTYTVTDGRGGFDSAAISVTVTAVNDPPTITNIDDRLVPVNSTTGALDFEINDIETPPNSLGLSRASSNPGLIPLSGIVFSGSGETRRVTITPAPYQIGTAVITITVSDGAATAFDTFLVTVFNTPPTIANIPDQQTVLNTPTGAITFTVGDAESVPVSLTLSGASNNAALVSNGNIVFGGSGASRTVTVTPVSGKTGYATLTITVSDGLVTAQDTFVLTVNPFAITYRVFLPAILR